MVVKKKYWGFGIGSLLLDTLLEWAKSNQFIKKINLRVRTDNQRAIKLYEKRGFVKEGTLRKEIFLNDKYYDLLWMGREL
jgi:RimJ/RimL family protein N-acetyltransferase